MQLESISLRGRRVAGFGLGASRGSKLSAGQSLKPGEELVSPNGKFKAAMQTDSNFVIYGPGNAVLRAWGIHGANQAAMQTDANFVLYAGPKAIWSSKTNGRGAGAYLSMQDDGNLVVYIGAYPIWDSATAGGKHYEGDKSAFEKITAPVTAVVHAVEKIPVVGDIVKITEKVYTAPLRIAADIASGTRLDRVAMSALKEQIKNAKDAAPYAATVVSFVPGIGTGAAAAISAGAALAEGKSIDEAAKAAIRGAIPGGALGQAAFDMATKVAAGESVTQAAIETARNQIPEGPARTAYDVGVAVATGEKIQTALTKGLVSLGGEQLKEVLAVGAKALETPGMKEALAKLPPGMAEQGFKYAAGLLAHKGINEKALTEIRNTLTPELVKGFDAALKTQESHTPWLANVTASAPKPVAIKAAPPRATPATPATPKAGTPAVPATPSLQAKRYAPYPQHVGVAGFFDSDSKWRYFAVYANGRPVAQQGPKWMSDRDAQLEAANFLEATQGWGYIGSVTRWDWNGRQWGLAGPMHPHPGGHHGHGGGHRGGGGFPRQRGTWGPLSPWWGARWSTEVVQIACATWGDPVQLSPGMLTAARSALASSGGRPTALRGPDGGYYLFALEGGAVTARPCAAIAAA